MTEQLDVVPSLDSKNFIEIWQGVVSLPVLPSFGIGRRGSSDWRHHIHPDQLCSGEIFSTDGLEVPPKGGVLPFQSFRSPDKLPLHGLGAQPLGVSEVGLHLKYRKDKHTYLQYLGFASLIPEVLAICLSMVML